VEQAVESALKQEHVETEVLVIDDGSTDATCSVLRRFHGSIRLVSTSNQGVNVARNLILELSRGGWVQYLDADDYLLPNKLCAQFAEVGDLNTIDVIYSPVNLEYRDALGRPKPLVKSVVDQSLDIYAQWLAWELPQTSGALWSRRLLEKLGGWNPERQLICDEHELYLRALQAGSRFRYAPSANAVYRIWSNQTRSHAEPATLIFQKSRLIIEMREWLLRRDLWKDDHERVAGQACFEMCRTLARYNLGAANRLFLDFRSLNLIALSGPAAPKRYQRTYDVLGFVGAELAARGSRAINAAIKLS
jgi:GT2 family glycosyltransferase